MPPNNKKQRGRRDKQKKKEAQNALFGTPAIDECINELAARSVSITAKASSSAAAVVSKSSASSSTTQTNDAMICYHESSAEHFVVGSPFLDMVKSYVSLLKKSYDGDVQLSDALNKFYNDKENQQIIYQDEFTTFVFALGVSLYLKVPSEDKEKYHRLQTLKGCAVLMEGQKTQSFELEIILQLGLHLKYNVIPHKTGKKTVDDKKYHKYLRDSESDRGIINCLYRETCCDCMETKKIEANDMTKMDLCIGCRRIFPKARTKVCDGCQLVVYCSKKCSVHGWPRHELFCTQEQERMAAAMAQKNKRKKNDKTKKNMAAATTGTATSNANGSMSTPTTQSISNPNLSSTSGGGSIGGAVLEPLGANKPVPTTAKPKNLPATAIIGVIALAAASFLGLGSFIIAPATPSSSPISPSPTVIKVDSGGCEGKTEY